MNLENNELDMLVVDAAKNAEDFEYLINKFRPLMWSKVSKLAGSSHDARDEMMSAAMRAFHEAVNTYDPEKGHFFQFMSKVIDMRLIDCLRKLNIKKVEIVPLEEESDDDSRSLSPLVKASLEAFAENVHQHNLVLEIEAFKQEISKWNFSMDMLVEHSPKQERTRSVYKKIVEQACSNNEIVKTIYMKRYYPIKKISEITKLPPKTIERARIYIIASIIIRAGDYDYLKSYIA